MITYPRGRFFLLFQIRGSALPKALPRAMASACACLVVCEVSEAQEWAAGSLVYPYVHQVASILVGMICVARACICHQQYWKAYGHIVDMSTLWLDSVTQLLSIERTTPIGGSSTSTEAQVNESDTWAWHLVHLFSLQHALACQQLRGTTSLTDIVPYVDTPVPKDKWGNDRTLSVLGSICQEEHDELRWCRSASCMVYGWIVNAIISRHNLGHGLQVASPMLSSAQQCLSKGLRAFQRSHEISKTQSPFPLAQFTSAMIWLMVLMVPVTSAAVATETVVAVVSCFFFILILTGLEEIALQLEHPCGFAFNCVPLSRMHQDFDEKLLTSLRPGPFPARPATGHSFARKQLASSINTMCKVNHGTPRTGWLRGIQTDDVRPHISNSDQHRDDIVRIVRYQHEHSFGSPLLQKQTMPASQLSSPQTQAASNNDVPAVSGTDFGALC